MVFSNAKKGIKKIILGQLFAIITTVLSSGIALLLGITARIFGGIDSVVATHLMLASFFIGLVSVVTITLTAVISFIGYIQASKDEADFRNAMFCALAVGALSVTGFFFKIPNGSISTIFNSASTIVEMFVMIFAISGVINLMTACERADMAEEGDRVLKILVITYIISAINSLIIRIFELSEHAKNVSIIIGVVDLVLSIIQYVIYIRFLRGSLAALP